MMKLLRVNPLDRSAWGAIAGYLAEAISRSECDQDWLLPDVREAANAGQITLWALVDDNGSVIGGGATAEILYPRRKVLDVLLLGAKKWSDWHLCMEPLKGLAHNVGAVAITGAGRSPWARKLNGIQKYGWEVPVKDQALVVAEHHKQLQTRATIEDLEHSMIAGVESGELQQNIFDATTKEGTEQTGHYFGDGVYVRTLLIPAGSTVIGRLHKQARVCMILSGTCLFKDEFQAKEVSAPWIGEFEAGSKTAVYALSDVLWAACLGAEKDDPEEIIKRITARSHAELTEQELLA